MKDIKVLGIDLAKNIFQIHGTNKKGKGLLNKRLSREKLIEFMSKHSPCVVGIEACTGAHYWARTFKGYGHTVKIMSPQFVKPYVKGNKNDLNDARAIAEAVTRPSMKFVPQKTIEQQDMLLSHRARELLVKQRTAQSNQLRGLLAEYGVNIARGISQIRQLPKILELAGDKLTERSKEIFNSLYEHFKYIDSQVLSYDKRIEQAAKEDVRCEALMKVEGIGSITASALVAALGDPSTFKNGREASAWLGLVPKQNSSGNKIRLGGISKRGDSYIRKLLIQGARAVVNLCEGKNDSRSLWIADKKRRGGYNLSAVALANKNARIAWALLAHGEAYRPAQVAQI
jgi:transposase